MQTIKIKHKNKTAIIFEYTCIKNNLKITIEAAIAAGTNLWDANLVGANLVGANLWDANLCGTVGIVTFGPVGVENRIVYLYINKDIQCRIGCFSGNLTEATKSIISKYGQNSTYELMLKAAAWSLASKNYV